MFLFIYFSFLQMESMHEAMSVVSKDKQVITGIIRNNHQAGEEMTRLLVMPYS